MSIISWVVFQIQIEFCDVYSIIIIFKLYTFRIQNQGKQTTFIGSPSQNSELRKNCTMRKINLYLSFQREQHNNFGWFKSFSWRRMLEKEIFNKFWISILACSLFRLGSISAPPTSHLVKGGDEREGFDGMTFKIYKERCKWTPPKVGKPISWYRRQCWSQNFVSR